MNHRESSLGQKVFNNTTFALMDMILTKAGTTIVFVLLVRLLPETDIAAIGICMGYLVLLAYFDVGPIRILLRDYPKIMHDRQERDQLLTALFMFMGLQVIAMIMVCFFLISFVFKKFDVTGLSFLFFGMTIDFMALMFQGWIKTIFYTDFQQPLATKIGFFFIIARLGCYTILFISPSLNIYIWILIFTSLANCVLWGVVFQRRFDFHPVFNRNIPDVLKQSLKSYGLWDHLNRMVIDTLFTIDTVILSWFAIGQLEDIGNYTIALKFTSLFFLIPMQLHLSLQVVLSNYNEDRQRFEAINTYIKLNSIVTFLQMLILLIGGKWLIHMLFGVYVDKDVINYAIIIGLGVTVMNLGWPLVSIINNLCSLHKAFYVVFLPSLTIGLAIYIGTVKLWGAIGLAYGNIMAYTILVLCLILFTIKQYPFPLKMKLITENEKRLIRKIMRWRT